MTGDAQRILEDHDEEAVVVKSSEALVRLPYDRRADRRLDLCFGGGNSVKAILDASRCKEGKRAYKLEA